MAERGEQFGGMVWGLILTGRAESQNEYKIEDGGWRVLAWLVELWRKDKQDEGDRSQGDDAVSKSHWLGNVI